MATAAYGHSQAYWSHQCVVGFLGRNKISNREKSEVMDGECGDGGGIRMTEGALPFRHPIPRPSVWATGTLIHWTKGNNDRYYFASVL
ncbi:hypothetical protein EVAR_27783_1 [Eumeta japonica]|uniref:Uncharacterized protein n=1 Tax=Eumeta variegata TaxID=151549 RepID=A0A4C1VC40_EUMVA|nr:hypothetical protein EVAR_27783_1 [Eumeta japonica]